MNTEQLLREAFTEQAQRAPDGGPILAVLRRPRARSRRPMLIAAGAAAVVVVAAGIPIALSAGGLVGGGSPDSPPVVQPGTQVEHPQKSANPKLKYTASWLPEGVVERARSSRFDAANQTRIWAVDPVQELVPQPDRATSWVQLTLGDFDAPGGEKVDINGHEGVLFNSGPTWTDLAWSPAEREILILRVLQVPDAKAVAVRIAKSVKADGASQVTAGLAFGPLPQAFPLTSAAVYGDGITELTASAGERTETLRVKLSRTPPAGTVSGKPIAVGKRYGLYMAFETHSGDPGPTNAYLSVQLDPNLWLEMSVTAAMDAMGNTSALTISEADLASILDRVELVPGQDNSWLGK